MLAAGKMAIRVPPIPIFSPPPLHLHHHNNTAPSEIRFSRWNNANAAPFIKRRREQEEIERDLRLHRILESASRITSDLPESTFASSPSSDFKSRGTPSSPSFPSIPGRKSKYSKPTVRNPRSSDLSHPAFRPLRRAPRKIVPEEVVVDGEEGSASASAAVKVGENGVSYVIENAPFEFQYSYTETPKVKPLGLREPLYMPFGPTTMPRPWTGRAPLPKSRKQLPEFDSFKPPPAGKKGVKSVQNPGPFLAGSGPKYGRTREEVLGEPLTEEEVKEMVQACMKITRQMNIGRDGLTHNMLDNIHAHWKRRRVCKIKCKGVCTVDMGNVRQQLEEKTGGKVIYGRGGVIFLFRGRNYNYKTRPKFPLMLWKPSSPIYPRLVQKVPEGLTLEEATEMRKRGRELPPICKLGKNGVYINLVKDVKEAFEECELVRINCNGLNKSDVRKIGAKLKDLVPCVLISFEFEHILMWRGNDWKSSLPPPEDRFVMDVDSVTNTSAESSLDYVDPVVKDKSSMESNMVPSGLSKCIPLEVVTESSVLKEDNGIEKTSEESNDDVISHVDDGETIIVSGSSSNVSNQFEVPCEDIALFKEDLHSGSSKLVISAPSILEEDEKTISGCESTLSVESLGHQSVIPQRPYMDGVLLLLKQAIDNGSAVILDSNSLDANYIYERAVDLAKTAPPGPVFKHQIRKKAKHKVDKVHHEKTNFQEPQVIDVESVTFDEKKPVEKRKQKNQPALDLKEGFSTTVPHGSLRVDELAKLLG